MLGGALAHLKGDVGCEQSLRVRITAPGASQAARAGRLTPYTGSSGISTLAKKAATLVLTALALGELLTLKAFNLLGSWSFLKLFSVTYSEKGVYLLPPQLSTRQIYDLRISHDHQWISGGFSGFP